MAKHRQTRGIANPTTLSSRGKEPHSVNVVIETPKGSRNKYSFNVDLKVFELKKVLPAGMAFPYDFGFIPSTLGGDGDPLDVLVLMDQAAFPGCLTTCRLIGIISGRQKEDDGWVQNDRLVAVEMNNHCFESLSKLSDLGKTFLEELEDFFVNYHELDGARYEVTNTGGPAVARRCVKAGLETASRRASR